MTRALELNVELFCAAVEKIFNENIYILFFVDRSPSLSDQLSADVTDSDPRNRQRNAQCKSCNVIR